MPEAVARCQRTASPNRTIFPSTAHATLDVEVVHNSSADVLEVEVREAGISLIIEDAEQGAVVRTLIGCIDARPPVSAQQLRA